jgi:hypothetical protein
VQPAKVMFVPLGLGSGVVAGLAARKLFDVAWHRISAGEPPDPGQRQASLPMLALALALEGAISRLSSGMIERGARTAFFRFTGSWPGDEEEAENG